MQLLKEIEDSLITIEKLFSKKELEGFLKCRYDKLYQYHFGLGMWIRNNL